MPACQGSDPQAAPPSGVTATASPVPPAPGPEGVPPVGNSQPVSTPAPGNPQPPARGAASVNAGDFAGQPGAYFFQSPSGAIKCAIYTNMPTLGFGCQSKYAPKPPAGCPQPWYNAAVRVVQNRAEHVCVNQGLYVGEPKEAPPVPGEGGGRMLHYGQTLFVQSISCGSDPGGITCWGRSGFRISRADVQLYQRG